MRFPLNFVTNLKTLLTCLFFLASEAAFAQVCAAPGKDGPAPTSGLVNSYFAPNATGNFNSASGAIALTGKQGATTTLAPGDLVMIIQMQCENINTTNTANYGGANGTGRGYTDPAGSCLAGQFEYVRAGPASSDASLDLTGSPLANTYIQDAATATNRRTFQIVRVPQYSSLSLSSTITVAPWNGTSGGVVAIDVAGNLNWNGFGISASGQGFRGGAGQLWNNTAATTADFVLTQNANNIHAQKGEGIAGTPRYVYNAVTNALVDNGGTWGGYAGGNIGRGAPGNAGGGGDNYNGARDNGGGGGGGNAAIGGYGGYGWKGSAWNAGYVGELDLRGIGGAAFAQVSATRMVMGGGGGAGGNNSAGSAAGALASSGSSGGGIVMVRAGSISGTGIVNVNGGSANDYAANDGGGGGGAAGSALIYSAAGSVGALTVNARGGDGGDSYVPGNVAHGGGGGGSGGVVFTSGAATTNVQGGTNGITNTGDNPPGGANHGATTGGGGVSTPSITTQPPGPLTGAQCLPQLTVSKSTTTPTRTQPAQTTAEYVISVSNATTAGIAYGVSVLDGLPTPFALQAVASTAASTYTGTLTTGLSPTATNQSGNTATATFGVSGGTAANSYTIAPGGRITLTFTVNINTTTVPQTFQNSASVTFTDPTRTTGGTAAAGGNPSVSPGGTYASGSTVAGSNYQSGSSTAEDVRLIGSVNVSLTKTNNVNAVVAGSTISYTITVANLTPSLSVTNLFLRDTPSAGLNCTSATCTNNGSTATCPAPYNPGPAPAASLLTGITLTTAMPANSSLSFVLTCGVTATGQ